MPQTNRRCSLSPSRLSTLLTCSPSGRPIATQFITLPDEDELPEYFDIIKLPVALDTIEEKLKRDAYPTITALESDFKRLVDNAKSYNEQGSQIYEDAERMRKLIYNYMKGNNPAYKDPGYQAFPTAIPDTQPPTVQNGGRKASSTASPGPREGSAKLKLSLSARTSEQPAKQTSIAPSAGTGADEEDDAGGESGGANDIDFTGMTFQDAQQKMIAFLLRYHDEE